MTERRDVRMQILLTAEQRRMLGELAQWKRRSMNDVVRLAIEREHQVLQARATRTAGVGETIKR